MTVQHKSIPYILQCGNNKHMRKGDSCSCHCNLIKTHNGNHSCYCGEKWDK